MSHSLPPPVARPFPPSLVRLAVQFGKFGLVGVAGLAVDTAVLYALLYGAGLERVAEGGFLLARVPSFLAAATATWALNRCFTFRHADHGRSLVRQWAAFVAANAFGGVVNYGAYAGCIAAGGVFLDHPVLAVAAGSLAGMFFNFAASKKLVFKGA
ncbi:putative flippase GtrA [Azospirillum fermentarium]|uniref:GtrA family protein n=1 Tax=Azospirillum fermentarium TaxID=1233114 RepID=UPI0022261828|nr:GtrA family protein [Azospirillum fermentarium]MCW2249450.1 putative flippase GtrA [Azospirillum fermentarium]